MSFWDWFISERRIAKALEQSPGQAVDIAPRDIPAPANQSEAETADKPAEEAKDHYFVLRKAD